MTRLGGRSIANLSRARGTAIGKAAAAASVAELAPRLAALERQIVAKRQVRHDALERVGKQLVEVHNRLVAAEIRAGIRNEAPIQKAGASLAEQLRAIGADRPRSVRKNGSSVFEGFFE